jgi:hypothetical protein
VRWPWCWTQVPNDLAGGDTEGRQQGAGAVADVFELTLFDKAGPSQTRGILALEDLHPGLLVAGEHQTTLVVEAWGVAVQLADGLGLGIEVGVVAVEPVLAAMGFEIGLAQDAADGAAAHVAVVGIAKDVEGEVIETPGGVGLLVVFGLATGECDDVKPFVGGKISGVVRSVVRLGGRSGRVRRSVHATDRRYGDRSRGHRRFAGWSVARVARQPGRSDNAERAIAAWSARGPERRASRVGRKKVAQAKRKDVALAASMLPLDQVKA